MSTSGASLSLAAVATSPDPAATSSRVNWFRPVTSATVSIMLAVVLIPPNRRLMRRKSESEPLISSGVPESVSRSSGVTTRRIPSVIRSLCTTIENIVNEDRKQHSAFSDQPSGKGRSFFHSGKFFFEQLLVVEILVVAVKGQEFVVSAVFDDAAFVQDGDAVGLANG